MEKPKNYDSVVANTGDYESLKLGGHEILIKNACEYTGLSGNTSLQICVDIVGNDDQKGFYQKQFDSNTNSDKKWSNGATKYVSLKDDEKCVAMFKGLITCVENSNLGFKFNFDEKTLINKKLAGQFGLEEYLKQDGTIGTATKLVAFRSLDKLKDIKIPKVKLLDGSYMDYEQYIATKKNNSLNNAKEIFGDSLTEVNDSDVPFEL